MEAIKAITHASNRAGSIFKELTGAEFYSKFQVRQNWDFLILDASVVAVTTDEAPPDQSIIAVVLSVRP